MKAVGVLVVLGVVLLSGQASAWGYVAEGDYKATHSFGAFSAYQNRYDITVSSGQIISYRVEVRQGPCVSVYLFRGHDVLELLPQYGDYVSGYSQWRCVPVYSNEYPVSPQDGDGFTLVVNNDQFKEVTYYITIQVRDGPTIVAGRILTVIFVAVLVATVVAIVWKWRRRPKQRE